MTAQEIQKRNERSQKLRVIQVDEKLYFVESSEGKICYKVAIEDDEVSCTCGDFARNIRTDAAFKCKHISSVLNCVPVGDIQNAQFLERKFAFKVVGDDDSDVADAGPGRQHVGRIELGTGAYFN